MALSTQKIISDPILGLIGISDFLPMIDVRPFQSLGFKYQLGLAFFLFPAATHTRKQHSFGAFKRTKVLSRYWTNWGMITSEQAQTLCAYALYHDIGHGPFSHMVEPLFDLIPDVKNKNNKMRADDAMALDIVSSLKPEIEKTGVNFNELIALFEHKNPLYLAVHDKNLGAEKFDYLERDSFYTIREVPGVDYLSRYVYFINNQVVVDEKVVDQAKAIQEFYIKMSKHVYLRKKAAILQRLVQKMAYELVKDGMGVLDLWNLTDFGLLGRFETSNNGTIRHYYDRIMAGQFPKTVMELKYEQFVQSDNRISDKALNIFGVPEGKLDKLIFNSQLMSLQSLEEIEKNVASLAGLPAEEIVISPPLSSHRFSPEDIKVYCRDNSVANLSDFYPNHFSAMVEYGRSHQLLRICTFPEHREKLNSQAEKVRDYILSLAK